MRPSSIQLGFPNGARLAVVPAVHFKAAFAHHVHQLCYHPETRPDAVAVELGPRTAQAIAGWMRELGLGPGSSAKLPCMLALVRGQQGAGMFEAEPDEHCGVAFLVPTDSIIEAICCAVELDVPLYGVDIEDVRRAPQRNAAVQDPSLAFGHVPEYVERNSRPYADLTRDEPVDSLREKAMAEHLKALLARHSSVLFTGGMGHWQRLRCLLEDPSVLPSMPEIPEESQLSREFRRTLVHPLLAVEFMDLFPAFTGFYQRWRHQRHVNEALGDGAPHPAKCFREVMSSVYKAYFAEPSGQAPSHQALDLEAREGFEAFLTNLCVVKQRLVPDLATAVQAAEGFLSADFCKLLVSKLMEFDWASPKQHNLPVLAPAPRSSRHAVLLSPDGSRGRAFRLELPRDRQPYPVRLPIPEDWKDATPTDEPGDSSREADSKDPRKRGLMGEARTWPPCDFLCTALSRRAAQLAGERTPMLRVEPFEGSLHDGLDIKATLRSFIRGDDRFYVRLTRWRRTKALSREAEGFPLTVWIFQPGRDERSDWILYGEDVELFLKNGYARDPDRMRRKAEELGEIVVDGVGFGTRDYPPEYHGEVRRYAMRGFVFFIPPHLTAEQDAIWVENSYERCPLIPGAGFWGDRMEPLAHTLRLRYGIELDLSDWPSALVLMALPYAQDTGVTVVAPDGFALPRTVLAEAARRRVEVKLVPLSYFPRDQVRRIATNYVVPTTPDAPGVGFPREIQELIGEPATTNKRLIPPWLADYGKRLTR